MACEGHARRVGAVFSQCRGDCCRSRTRRLSIDAFATIYSVGWIGGRQGYRVGMGSGRGSMAWEATRDGARLLRTGHVGTGDSSRARRIPESCSWEPQSGFGSLRNVGWGPKQADSQDSGGQGAGQSSGCVHGGRVDVRSDLELELEKSVRVRKFVEREGGELSETGRAVLWVCWKCGPPPQFARPSGFGEQSSFCAYPRVLVVGACGCCHHKAQKTVVRRVHSLPPQLRMGIWSVFESARFGQEQKQNKLSWRKVPGNSAERGA